MTDIMKTFGKKVFNDTVMKERLSEPTYRELNNTIKNGEYPYINPYYVVIGKDAKDDSPAKRLYNWILSPDGQKLTEMEGYVPAKGE